MEHQLHHIPVHQNPFEDLDTDSLPSDTEPEPVLSVQQLLQLATPSSRSKFSTDWVTNPPRDVVRDVHPIPSSPVNPNPHLNFPSNPVPSPSSVDLQVSHRSTHTTSLPAVVYLRNAPKHISVDEVQSKLSSEVDGCSITQPLRDSNFNVSRKFLNFFQQQPREMQCPGQNSQIKTPLTMVPQPIPTS